MKNKECDNWGGIILSEKGEDIDIPNYFSVVSCDKIKVRIASVVLGKDEIHIITKKDVTIYFKTETQSTSGIRVLGTIVGDWRMVHNLAEELLFVFKEMEQTGEGEHENC